MLAVGNPFLRRHSRYLVRSPKNVRSPENRSTMSFDGGRVRPAKSRAASAALRFVSVAPIAIIIQTQCSGVIAAFPMPPPRLLVGKRPASRRTRARCRTSVSGQPQRSMSVSMSSRTPAGLFCKSCITSSVTVAELCQCLCALRPGLGLREDE